MKKILSIYWHTRLQSFCWDLLTNYENWLKDNRSEIIRLNLINHDFNPYLIQWNNDKNISDDVQSFQNYINDCEHMIFAFPLRWYGMPAILKGFFDRTFLHWFAYKYQWKPLPEKLLKWKTADIIITADGPWWYYLIFWNPWLTALKRSLNFCWIKVVNVFPIYWVRKISLQNKQKILNKFYNLGKNS